MYDEYRIKRNPVKQEKDFSPLAEIAVEYKTREGWKRAKVICDSSLALIQSCLLYTSHIGYTNRGTLLQALEENRESLVLLRRSERESLEEHLRQASRQDRRMTLDSQLVLENQVYRQQTNLERQRIQAEEPEEFTYMPAQMVVTRPGGGIRERQAPPSAPDIETIVRQVKKETVNDIQFINRRQSETDEYKKNEQQLGELLNKLSGQQKELEQLKQVQARLIHSTDPGRLAETVMKQFRSQLQVEKMRRGM